MRRHHSVAAAFLVSAVVAPAASAATVVPVAQRRAFARWVAEAAAQCLRPVRQQRARLLSLRPVTEPPPAWVTGLAAEYGVTAASPDALVEALLMRVDEVPVGLIVAVAALETGWGTSRFALEARNLFGIRCSRPGCGVRPSRAERPDIYVRTFANHQDAVCTFVHLLNTGERYREFRRLRASLRRNGKPLDAYVLAAGLKAWSELGPEYVRRVRSVLPQAQRLIRY